MPRGGGRWYGTGVLNSPEFGKLAPRCELCVEGDIKLQVKGRGLDPFFVFLYFFFWIHPRLFIDQLEAHNYAFAIWYVCSSATISLGCNETYEPFGDSDERTRQTNIAFREARKQKGLIENTRTGGIRRYEEC